MTKKMTMQEAIDEANRCLKCSKPLCRSGCPINNDIPGFIQALSEGNIGYAYQIIADRTNLPAICGRVCAQEKQCEAHCILEKKNDPIKIGSLEMFVADFVYEHGLHPVPPTSGKRGKIAVIGSGPAGLTVAGDLAKIDFDVTIFESLEEPGGILLFGIPDFRLEKDVVRREIGNLEKLGVKIETNVVVGPDKNIDELFSQGFDAIFMGTGTAMPNTLDIPGKDFEGIYTATYFLRMIVLFDSGKLDKDEDLVKPSDHIAIIGAGNVAIDAARTAIRRNPTSVTVIYRGEEDEMTCLPSEYELAKKEGIEFRFLQKPIAYINKKQMRALTGDRRKFEASDDSVVAGIVLENVIKDNEENQVGGQEIFACDTVILAVGQKPAARIVSTTTGIEVSEDGFVITKQRPYGMTTRGGVFSSGDVVHGPKTVVHAMKESKKVAKGIQEYVDAKKLLEECK